MNIAVIYAKTLIGERFLPLHLKSIKPLDIGGTAGGDKFIVQGILFKFSQNNKALYGCEKNAQKAAGHELKV